MEKNLVITHNITFYSRDGLRLFGYDDIKRFNCENGIVSFEIWGDGEKRIYSFEGLAFKHETIEGWQ